MEKGDKVSDKMYSRAEILESYAVEMRYPNDWYEPTEKEAREAYSIRPADNPLFEQSLFLA